MSMNCGGVYFKAGQYFGTLEHILPKEYIEVLSALQDQGAELPFKKIKVVYESDHQCRIDQVFSEIDEIPIASASLAQVHRAKLRETGEEVAVKLQYPQLRTQMKVDLWVLKQLFNLSYKVG